MHSALTSSFQGVSYGGVALYMYIVRISDSKLNFMYTLLLHALIHIHTPLP